MSLAFGRYSARSGLRARRATERGSKPGQPCTHGINLGRLGRVPTKRGANDTTNAHKKTDALYDSQH
eukprot:scaffold120456_cov54-Phaeocystis_antarctica.AAC.1